MKKSIIILAAFAALFTSCSENSSNGKRIGFISQFSEAGRIWKSWEGHLNQSQTGMNTANSWDFSIDNDVNDPNVIATIDSAANNGWKVELEYHLVWNKNWFSNRGNTDYFVKSCKVLDRDPMGSMFGRKQPTQTMQMDSSGLYLHEIAKNSGHDTVYVIILNQPK